MRKTAEEKSSLWVKNQTTPGSYAVGGVAGLQLQVKPSGARSWVLRVRMGGKRRDVGLGGYPTVTLAQARERARAKRDMIEAGIDPVAQRQEARSTLLAAQQSALTFREACAQYIASHESAWRNPKHGAQWTSTLATYAEPVIGNMLVADIQMPHVLKVLEPIWKTKTETASRLRGRIERVLDWAKGRGYRVGDNPAAWKGNLDAQLAAPKKIAKVEHHTALPVDAMYDFMVSLRKAEGMGARALEFAILTAARSGEVRGATWAEIDLDAKVWTVPGSRMKAGREHRVPLSTAAIELLKAVPKIAGTDLLFPSTKLGKPLSDMTLAAVLKRMEVDAVPHGFRSTFRDWTAEYTSYPNEVCEMALAHTVGSAVEAAYRRGDLLEKRARMMEDWSTFVSTPMQKGTVVPMRRRRA